jgi:hypothetical protein
MKGAIWALGFLYIWCHEWVRHNFRVPRFESFTWTVHVFAIGNARSIAWSIASVWHTCPSMLLRLSLSTIYKLYLSLRSNLHLRLHFVPSIPKCSTKSDMFASSLPQHPKWTSIASMTELVCSKKRGTAILMSCVLATESEVHSLPFHECLACRAVSQRRAKMQVRHGPISESTWLAQYDALFELSSKKTSQSSLLFFSWIYEMTAVFILCRVDAQAMWYCRRTVMHRVPLSPNASSTKRMRLPGGRNLRSCPREIVWSNVWKKFERSQKEQ